MSTAAAAALAGRHHLGEAVALDDVVGGVGRGDDDVGLLELLGQLLEADRLAVEALGEADRAVVVAVGDEDGGDAAGDQRPGDELGGLAGADDEHPALGEVAERAPRQLDRDRGDREALLADLGLLADAAAGGERAAEEAVEDRPGGALDQGQLVGAFDLALDLGLADDHRVEPGGDPEEVVGGLDAAARVEVAEQLGGRDLRLPGEDAERRRLGFDRVGDDQVELGAVAGRDRRRLVDALGGGQLAQGADGAALGQREPLAQVERRRLVGDAEGQQLAHLAPTSSASGCRRGLLAARPVLGEPGQLAQLLLDPLHFRRHDRDVDDEQDEEDDVGAGDVLAGLVERQRRGGDRQQRQHLAHLRGDPRRAAGRAAPRARGAGA